MIGEFRYTPESTTMNLNKVDLNLFIVFDAIYTEANLTRAGQIVGITQPAVSNALARLRETFNDPLFVRTAQGMVPTPMAQNIIGPVRNALQLLRVSVQESRTFNPLQANKTFRISMTDLTDAMDAPLNTDPQVRHVKLLEDRYVCAMRRGHPLAKDKLSVEEYLSLSHIHISSRRSGLGMVDLALGKMGQQRKIALRSQHYMMATQVIQQTDMAVTVPERFARRHDLHQIPLPVDIPPLETHIYWHESTDQDPANRWMREQMIEIAQQVTAQQAD